MSADGEAKDGRMPVRATLWALAAAVAVVGVVVAIAMASPWPLVAIAGLAVPLMPIGRGREGR